MKHKERKKHYQGRNYHHVLLAKTLGGPYTDNNLLLIKIERHEAWHKLWGNLTLRQVIRLLIRLERMKEAKDERERNDF